MDTRTSSDRKLSYAGPSQYELRQEYSFLLFSKAFLALQGFLFHKFNDFIFFCVFDGFLKKKYGYFYLSLIPTLSLESNLFYHIPTEKKRFLDVLAGGELIKG